MMRSLFAQFTRFLGIGFLNTALDFAALNSMMFYFGIFTGSPVGFFSAVSFLIAVSHSYFWNRYLVFKRTEAGQGILYNLGEFIYAGLLGAAVVLAVGFGAAQRYSYGFYLALLLTLALGEIIFWYAFRIWQNVPAQKSRTDFAGFVFITLIGLAINAGMVTIVTVNVPPRFGINQELWTNLAKAAATAISLVWNFTGYRIVVFKYQK